MKIVALAKYMKKAPFIIDDEDVDSLRLFQRQVYDKLEQQHGDLEGFSKWLGQQKEKDTEIYKEWAALKDTIWASPQIQEDFSENILAAFQEVLKEDGPERTVTVDLPAISSSKLIKHNIQ